MPQSDACKSHVIQEPRNPRRDRASQTASAADGTTGERAGTLARTRLSDMENNGILPHTGSKSRCGLEELLTIFSNTVYCREAHGWAAMEIEKLIKMNQGSGSCRRAVKHTVQGCLYDNWEGLDSKSPVDSAGKLFLLHFARRAYQATLSHPNASA